MKVAIVGSKNLIAANLSKYIPPETTEIVSGGQRSIGTYTTNLVVNMGLKLTEFLPEYEKYGRRAPLARYIQMIEYSDLVLAFWDGKSLKTSFVISKCIELDVFVKIFMAR